MSLILSGTNGVSEVDGSAATPAIRGTDTNTGIFFPAADTIAFAEGSAEIARFDSSGNALFGTTTNTNNSRIVSNGVIESTTGGVRFPDGTTQTTAAGGLPSAYGVGSYVAATKTTSGTVNTTAGETIAGSSLRFSASVNNPGTILPFGAYGSSTSVNPSFSGTWRAMSPAGQGLNIFDNSGVLVPTLWMRIS